MAAVNVACHMCGATSVDSTQLELVLNAVDNVDLRFVHCDTATQRRITIQEALVLRTLAVPLVDARPPGERHCSCGLAMFPIGDLAACRNCDAPMAGLPPADKKGMRR